MVVVGIQYDVKRKNTFNCKDILSGVKPLLK